MEPNCTTCGHPASEHTPMLRGCDRITCKCPKYIESSDE